MEIKSPWYELVKRVENFRWNLTAEGVANGDEKFYMSLYDLKNECITDLNGVKKLAKSEILAAVFRDIYNLVVKQSLSFGIFDEDSPIHDDVYEACLFTTLGIFLHESKRIEGKSLGEFVFQYSPMGYYREYSSYQDSKDDRLTSEATTLRQTRHRILSSRAGRDINPQWSAMRKDSEHEWSLYFPLQYADENAIKNADIFKRVGNLYKDVKTALESPKDDGYTARLEAAYKKFSSKLNKIQYTSYLELLQDILRHIENDKAYYGINLYRFEKELRAFAITNDVKDMLACRTSDEENCILRKSIILNDIWFPSLYRDFGLLCFYEEMERCARVFPDFLNTVLYSACLIIDELVEKGHLGEQWEALFIKMTNEMAERVFYNPSDIDFNNYPGAQEKFMKILDAPVRNLVFQEQR